MSTESAPTSMKGRTPLARFTDSNEQRARFRTGVAAAIPGRNAATDTNLAGNICHVVARSRRRFAHGVTVTAGQVATGFEESWVQASKPR